MNHLQNVILIIAKDIARLLEENDIPFFLDGGTALGAVRHGGFIPWDDDFDIIILPEYYDKFVDVCRTKLNKEKYAFIEAEKDWPLHISKIKLKGTSIEEIDEFPMKEKGIYIDIFCFDYASNLRPIRYLQWLFTRLWVVLTIAEKPYTTNSFKKKFAISIAKIINTKFLRKFVRYLGRSHRKTKYLSMAWCRTRSNWKRYFCDRGIFDNVRMTRFENQEFPVPERFHDYLKICFGDYMVLPPVEKRVGLHVISVDYGKY